MSEIERTEQRTLQFNRWVRVYRDDFETKTEKKIYDFFAQHARSTKQISNEDILNNLFGLNADNSKDGIISDEDINNFLTKCQQGNYKINGKQVKTNKLKDVTADDIRNFLSKFLDLNPTEYERKYKEFINKSYIDESGKNILNKNLFKLSNDGYISSYDVPSDYKNEDFKLLDLNEDGKIDNLEYGFWGSESKDPILKGLSKIDGESNDKKITSEEKNRIYQQLVDADNKKKYDTLSNMSLKDESGNEVITNEVKSLFSLQKLEISVDDLVDENGNIKTGLKLFDLNGDNKLDDKEKAYFTSQGKIVDSKDKITLGDFIVILDKLQLFDKSSDKLSSSERELLYKYIDSAFLMMDGLEGMPDGVKELYENALGTISVLGTKEQRTAGEYSDWEKSIRLSKRTGDKYYLASTLLHELTHHICYNFSDKKINSLAQEVQCFYMEYKLQEQFTKIPGSTQKLTGEAYEAKLLKDNNPELSELDIAKFLFMKEHYEYYSKYYHMQNDDYVYNAEYKDIGGYFEEDKNKKNIYEASIQKAFSGLEIKDENGNNLITEELKNLFTANKPIIQYCDLIDENKKIKKGLELFDMSSGEYKTGNIQTFFSTITYNDIPRIVDMFKKLNTKAVYSNDLFNTSNNKNDILTQEKRKFFVNQIVCRSDFERVFNYHKKQ